MNMNMNTRYPLLSAWLNDGLRSAWIAERGALRREDPKLLVSVAGMEAAARVSARLTQEMERLTTDVWRLRNQHRFDAAPYIDEVIGFHDALRRPDRKSYRDILGAISGNQHVWAEEERYLKSVHYMTPEQLEAHEFNLIEIEMESL